MRNYLFNRYIWSIETDVLKFFLKHINLFNRYIWSIETPSSLLSTNHHAHSTDTFEVLKRFKFSLFTVTRSEFNRYIWSIETKIGRFFSNQFSLFNRYIWSIETFSPYTATLPPSNSTDTFEVLKLF